MFSVLLQNLFQHLYKAAAISGASSHSGRRQFVTELADKGVNARVVQALARHKHLNTTQRYIDVNESKLVQLMHIAQAVVTGERPATLSQQAEIRLD